MNRCKDCKWWDNKPYLNAKANGLKEDEVIMRQCRCEKVNLVEVYGSTDGMAQCGVDAGYPSNCTGPEFGCVHWEAKEQCPHPLGSRVQKDLTWRCDQCGQEFSGDALEEVSA